MKVLIATDGSDFSKAAIDKACEMLVRGGNNSIEIIAVYEEVAYTGAEPYGFSSDYIHEMEKIARQQVTEFADEAEKTIRLRFANSSVQLTTKIVKGTSAGRAIVEEAQAWGADLIVLGSHGYGFWGRTFLGSTSDKVIHFAPCSVLIVRKKPGTNGSDS
jgi:nucleotide-binding universal stress UspA family protein